MEVRREWGAERGRGVTRRGAGGAEGRGGAVPCGEKKGGAASELFP
jgi:hypothetical protein